MQIRRLGRTGLKVSEICLGTMTFGHQCDEKTSFAILDKAAAGGVTFLDCADVYPVPPSPETAGRSEAVLGQWLEGRPRREGCLRRELRLEVGPDAVSREDEQIPWADREHGCLEGRESGAEDTGAQHERLDGGLGAMVGAHENARHVPHPQPRHQPF